MLTINVKTILAVSLLVVAGALYFFFNQKQDNSDQIDLTTTSQSGGTSVAQNTSAPLATAPLPRTKPTPTTPSPISQSHGISAGQDTSKMSAAVPELRGITPQFVNDNEAKGTPLPSELKKIKETAQSIFIAREPGSEDRYASVLLHAIGHRYVLVTPPAMRPTCNRWSNREPAWLPNGSEQSRSSPPPPRLLRFLPLVG